jgi:hypothetical protein
MGIEFQYANDAERRATESIVEKLMADELGDGLTARLLGRKADERQSALPPPPALPTVSGLPADSNAPAKPKE